MNFIYCKLQQFQPVSLIASKGDIIIFKRIQNSFKKIEELISQQIKENKLT